ncbi:host specificity protein J [uncultured Haemophilus sp.]|uniref:host specificity protein J n=1 Tax=uncultured Haemophilus sp. TaxID=237779 RepID=UPI00345BB751
MTVGVQSLFSQAENGDTSGTTVELVVTIGSQSYPVSISGKYSSQYLQQHTFDNLPPVPFTVKVERVTEDSKSQRLQNNTVWSSYTEIIDTEFTYPNTALIGVKFDSEYFSNIPARTYDLLGLRVKVPSNYDTRTRKYTGMWDGTFKVDWTDNPAWILYDIVTSKRYGLGNRLGEFGADKWALYQVSQYCDQLVPDGFGGQEPRFTCNAWLTEQRSAYDVINDICSIFRAMPVWNGQQLTVVMDRPLDPVWTYTNANVEKGEFNYTFSAKKARHNAIQVEYSDKDNGYEKAIEYVSDDEEISKHGLNVKKVTAFGCTSRGQAHRTGLWLLQTEKLETKTVTFTVGAEGLMHVPGDIIKVADTYYAGTNVGGRVLAINGKKVTLDREISINGNSYFSYINAQAKHQDIKIISVNGTEVTLEQNPVGLKAYGVWSLSTQQVASQLFKAISVKEETKGKYTITALQHEPQKEAIVDNGAKFEPKATSILSVPQVSNIGVTVNSDGSVSFAGDITGGNGVIKYDFRIYKDGALFDIRLGQTSPNLNLDGLENGEYSVLIQVKNEKGQVLSERTQTFVIDKPPAPTGVRVTGGLGNITIEWDWINDATATEIFVSETNDIKTATRLTKVTARMYTHEVGAKKVRYYWLRHTRGVNVGPFSQQGGLRGESSVDIDAELEILNKKLSQNIVNEVIDTALPARNLDLIKTVNGLNVGKYQGHKQVYNTADGKLYTWNGSKYLENGIDASGIRIKTTQLVGTLQADQIGANTIGAGALQAGAVRAEHMAAGQITADKLAIGLGGNLLYNPIFDNNAYGWSENRGNGDLTSQTTSLIRRTSSRFSGLVTNGSVLIAEVRANSAVSSWWQVATQVIRVVPNQRYCLSAFVDAWNCTGELMVQELSSDGSSWVRDFAFSGRRSRNISGYSQAGVMEEGSGSVEPSTRTHAFFIAPSSGYVSVVCIMRDIQTASTLKIANPMLEECAEYTTQPSPWQNAGVTAIHGGSIVTNSITTQQMAANSITANEIATGAVAAKHVAVGSIGATHIATRSLTADKLNVSQLSAVSSNMGDINGGSLNINNRFKVSRSGQVEMRASAGNVGMIITNEAISVYDERGRLRVKMGRL